MAEVYSPPTREQQASSIPLEAKYWYVLLLSGGLGILVGVLVLSDPSRSLKALATIVGIYLLVIGVLLIARTVLDEDRGAGGLLLGALSLIAGAIVIRHPGNTVVVVSMALGIYFLVAGALALARAIIGPYRLHALARAVVFIAGGVIITSSTEISVKTLALITGIALCLEGAVQIGEAFVLRSISRQNLA